MRPAPLLAAPAFRRTWLPLAALAGLGLATAFVLGWTASRRASPASPACAAAPAAASPPAARACALPGRSAR